MLMKHLTSPKIGFDSFTVSFGTTSACSLIIQLIGILWYWQHVEQFNLELFIRGLIGSTSDNLGMAFIAKALSTGPAGPIFGLISLNSVLLTAYEAIRLGHTPNIL
jgi:hypothetical protein